MAYERDPNEIGALWIRENQDGSKRLTGTINGEDVVCWQVKSDNPKAPAFRVKKSAPRQQAKPITSDDIGF